MTTSLQSLRTKSISQAKLKLSQHRELGTNSPMNVFEVEGKVDTEVVKVGAMLPMQDQNGNPMHGVILEMKETAVKMDFNHVLAGKDLHFTGKILDVREASAEELEHGHVHGPGGHEH
jgi:FKBP-type peptidyl-prolyl cis-trans isomerase SlyD